MVDLKYLASTCECIYILDTLKGGEIDTVYHTATMKKVREEMKKKIEENYNSTESKIVTQY